METFFFVSEARPFNQVFIKDADLLAPLCSKLQRAKATSRELLRWKTCCVDCCKSSSDISSRRHASKTSSVSLSKLKVQKLSLLALLQGDLASLRICSKAHTLPNISPGSKRLGSSYSKSTKIPFSQSISQFDS